MTWFDDSSFWIMHHVFFVHNAPNFLNGGWSAGVWRTVCWKILEPVFIL